MTNVITEEELFKATGFKLRGHLEKCLRKQGVKFFYGLGGRIWTTIDALNISLGVTTGKQEQPKPDWDFV